MSSAVHQSFWIALALLPVALWACAFVATRFLRRWSPLNPVHRRGCPRRPHHDWSNRRWIASLAVCLAAAVLVLAIT